MLIQQSNDSQPHGMWKFIIGKPTLLPALIGGLSLMLASFGFTFWLSLQTLSCPPWARDCKVVSFVGSTDPGSVLPLIQGFISLSHGLGLTCLFFVTSALAEPTLWPLLRRKSYNLATIDAYLQGTRGSLPSLLEAMFHIKDSLATIVLLSLALVAALSQVDRVIIGQVYSLQNTAKTFQSTYQSGGGIGINISDSNSNGPLADPAIKGFASYISWAKSLSEEPLPDMREFLVDRYNLSSLQSFTVSALKAQKTVTCSGRSLKILESFPNVLNVTVEDGFTSQWIRTDPRLSCWIDSRRLISPMTTVTTLVFAAINGFIEDGAVTKFGDSNITSLQCDVKTELVQVTYSHGSGGPQSTELSSNATILGPDRALSNVANWMGGAVTTFGVNIFNARPMFGVGLSNGQLDSTMLPQIYSTVYAADGNGWDVNYWTQPMLINFINVTAGAIAVALSQQMNNGSAIIHSNFRIPELSTPKSFLLLLPMGLILCIVATLLTVARWSHHATRIQHVRPATIPEWTKISCTVGTSKELPISNMDFEELRFRLERNHFAEWELEIDEIGKN